MKSLLVTYITVVLQQVSCILAQWNQCTSAYVLWAHLTFFSSIRRSVFLLSTSRKFIQLHATLLSFHEGPFSCPHQSLDKIVRSLYWYIVQEECNFFIAFVIKIIRNKVVFLLPSATYFLMLVWVMSSVLVSILFTD